MNQSTSPRPSIISLFNGDKHWYALFIVALALVFNLARTAPDIIPGESAQLVAQHAGHDVFAPMSHVAWGWAGRLFEFIPVGNHAFRWNLLSAVAGAAACGMVFLLTRRLMGRKDDKLLLGGDLYAYRNLAGLVAGLLLVFCQPLHIVSTMANPATFELLLLLVSIWLLARFHDTGHLRFGVGAMALFGAVITQYAFAIMLAPLFGIMMLYVTWRKNHFRPPSLTRLLLAFTAGLSLFLVIALLFMQKPGYQWAELDGIGQVLWFMARDLYAEIRVATPRIAIILVVIYSLLPFICVVIMSKQMTISYFILILICALLSALLFLNFRFAPWPMFGFRPLLIAPYVIAAAWSGCLVAYVMGLIKSAWLFRFHYNRIKWIQPTLSVLWLALAGTLILASGWKTVRNEGASSTRGIAKYAGYMVNQLDDNMWIVVDGQLEPVLRIKCAEIGRNPLIISSSRIHHRPYLNALAHQLNNERLGSMAEMGLIPLIREQLDHPEGPEKIIAVAGDPGILRFVIGTAWPDRTIYTSEKPNVDAMNWAEYMENLRAWWRHLPISKEYGPFNELIKRLHIQSARIANDTGIFLEENGKHDFAREAFLEAIRIHPQNLSAHLNLRGQLPNGESADWLEEDIERLSAMWRGRATLAQIMDVHGLIRHDAAIETVDQRWGRTDPVSRLDETILQLLQLEDEEAFGLAMTISNNDSGAKLAIARIVAGKNRHVLARKILNSIDAKDDFQQSVILELANLDIQMGFRDRAYQTLSAIPETEISDPRILILLASLTVDSDPQKCDQYLGRLENYPNLLPSLVLPIARILESRQKPEKAIRHLAYLTALQPFNRDAIQMIIRLHLDQQDIPSAITYAKQLFTIESHNPLANAALALHLESRGNLPAADKARRIALSGNPLLSIYFE
ncbi:MAG TPA: DUF2723 domain-containing protein [Kiritimatiellia bacterium]|nr:DUF2723 domain-containing protein [Kiritimatiellia bacterium]